MKIAFITPFLPYRGGISKHSENLYNVIKLNHEIHVFNFSRQYPNLLFPGKTQYSNNLEKVNNYDSKRIIDSINPLTWTKATKEILEQDYDRVIIRFWHPFFIPCYNSICKKIKKSNPKISIFAICDNIIAHESYVFHKFLVKSFLNKLDGVMIMSDNVKKELLNIDNNINYKKLFLPILDDLSESIMQTDAQNKIGINNQNITFLFFGLIRKYKGLDRLIKALSFLDSKDINKIQLLVVGECYENIKEYFKMIDSRGLNNHVRWIDQYIDDNEVGMYFSASDYVVVPYRTASQSGIIPMAYFYNKPIIGSNIEGISEQIINNKTGYLFDNQDELIKIIKNIISNHDSKENLTDNINEYKKSFSTKVLANEVLNFIK